MTEISQSFTLGFIFDRAQARVLLIHKNRPAWQAGRINGVGGKVEPGETMFDCIRREVREESGLATAATDWTHVADMQGDDPEGAGGWIVHVLTAVYDGNPTDSQTMTDESVAWYPVDTLPAAAISNLTWLIPLCLDRLRHGTPRGCVAQY